MKPRRMISIPSLTVPLLFLGWAVSSAWCASLSDENQIKLPDTPAGQHATAFFAAFNTGDDERIRDFEKQHRAEAALRERSIEDRVQQARQLREQWGTLTPLRVVHSAEHETALLVHTSQDDANFEFRFLLESEPPHGLIGIQIMGPVDLAEVEANAEPLDDQTRNDTITSVAQTLKETYVYPEVGKKMSDALARYQSEGRYNGLTSAGELAHKLTEDLRAICNDRHLAIRPGRPGPDRSMIPHHRKSDRATRSNYGFRQVELLPNNIGYIKLNMFHDSKEAQQTAAAALAFVAHCDALILDLRDNGGGSPEMIQFISSYLFDKPIHLNSFYDRLSDKTSETWTLEDIPGQRFDANLPVYVLTSNHTFSAAEEFTYNLKHLKRATIVGETTGGGAHPVTEQVVNDRFRMMVPYARAENPITKTNWEGVGVVPHIETSATKALDAACADAAKKINTPRSQDGS